MYHMMNNLLGARSKDNYKNIEYVLENIPHGCDLVIKEHPVNPGMMEYKS